MANQTAWKRDTPGLTLYAYPLSQDIADWATYAVTFTEKGDGGGWYSAVLDDTYLDWAIFDAVPTSWDESQYSSISLEVEGEAAGGQDGIPYYSTVRRNADDDNAIVFSWGSNTTLTAQVSLNNGPFTAVAGTISVVEEVETGLWKYELGYDAADRPESGVAEYAITDGTDTFYLPLSIDIGGGAGGGGGSCEGDGTLDVGCTVENTGGTPLSNIRVFVQNSDGVDLGIYATTTSLGVANFRLDPGTYKFGVPATTGYDSLDPVTYVVSATTTTPTITLTPASGVYRTTSTLVAGLLTISPTMDLEPFIATAHNLVDQVEECSSSLSDSTLELIERWLAAHFYAIANPQHLNSKSIGGASKSYALGQLGERLHSTYYGQQAILLDTSGCLEQLTSERAQVLWAGDENDLDQYDVNWN